MASTWCAATIVTARASAALLRKKLAVEEDRIVKIPNGFWGEHIDSGRTSAELDSDRFTVAHVGALAASQARDRAWSGAPDSLRPVRRWIQPLVDYSRPLRHSLRRRFFK